MEQHSHNTQHNTIKHNQHILAGNSCYNLLVFRLKIGAYLCDPIQYAATAINIVRRDNVANNADDDFKCNK